MASSEYVSVREPNLTEKIDRIASVTADRGSSYGHPSVHFARVAKMKEVISHCPDKELAHVLDMIADKIARLIESPLHEDSWVDIAGYARTAAMVIDARKATPTPRLDRANYTPGERPAYDPDLLRP